MQKNTLKIRALLILCLLAAFPPLSTDMYLPALPLLVASWDSTPATINLTLVGFFISFSVALLVYGPLSDRYGRKPVLLAGISLYILACLGCAWANSATALIIGRVAQGLGAASAATLSLAMTKDYFDGAERVQAMTKMAIIISLAPMLAPVLGGLLMQVMSWPAIFYTQAMLGALAIWGVRQLTEPVAQSDRSLRDVIHSYGRLMLNARFIGLCFLIALGMTPLFCYIGGSSFIFITHFGLSEQEFSYFFAFNSAALMSGFYLCSKLLKHMSALQVICLGYAGICMSAILLCLSAQGGPWSIAWPMAAMTMSLGMSRPPSNHFLLEQVRSDAGSAASLIMFTYFVGGAVAMWFIALPWANKVLTLGMVGVASSLCVLLVLPRAAKMQ